MTEHDRKTPSRADGVEEMRPKKKSPEPSLEKLKACRDEPGPFTAVLESAVGEPLLERHAALLDNERFSYPANAGQVVRTATKLQQNYGNAYVQRLVGLIQAKKDEALPEEERDLVDIGSRIGEHKGSGQPLEPKIRSEMEAAFSQDFGGVRVHTDADADELSKELGARAFTSGKHIFFRGGAYEPRAKTGVNLLTHELTHVVQQERPMGTHVSHISQPYEPLERQAEVVGQSLAGPGGVTKQSEATGVVARQVTEASPLTFRSWEQLRDGYLYNKYRSQLETAGYKFIMHMAREPGRWDKGSAEADTPARQVAWSIACPDGTDLWGTTATITSVCAELVKTIPVAKPEAPLDIKWFEDPEAASKDPHLVTDTTSGVAVIEKNYGRTGMLIIKGRPMEIEPGTVLGAQTFIAIIGDQVYYKYKNTIRKDSLNAFEKALELGEIGRQFEGVWIHPVDLISRLLSEVEMEVKEFEMFMQCLWETFASGEAWQSYKQMEASAIELLSFGLIPIDGKAIVKDLEERGYKRPLPEAEAISQGIVGSVVGLATSFLIPGPKKVPKVGVFPGKPAAKAATKPFLGYKLDFGQHLTFVDSEPLRYLTVDALVKGGAYNIAHVGQSAKYGWHFGLLPAGNFRTLLHMYGLKTSILLPGTLGGIEIPHATMLVGGYQAGLGKKAAEEVFRTLEEKAPVE